MKKKNPTYKNGHDPSCMKGTSIEFGILNKGLDEIYNVHSDLSSKKRKKKTVQGVANGTSKNVGLGKFWKDLEIS